MYIKGYKLVDKHLRRGLVVIFSHYNFVFCFRPVRLVFFKKLQKNKQLFTFKLIIYVRVCSVCVFRALFVGYVWFVSFYPLSLVANNLHASGKRFRIRG